MIETSAFRHVYLGPSAAALVPRGRLRRLAQELVDSERPTADKSLVVACASWLLRTSAKGLPAWVDSETRYLVIADIAEPAILRLAAVLGLRKPHLRLHVSRDTGIVKRLVLAQARRDPWEGIVDAYSLEDHLVVVLGDMTIREFPNERLPRISTMAPADVERFEVDESGSFLHWQEGDVHLGASQLLQATDPMYLTDVEIQRYAREKVSLALLDMRNERGLKQTDVPGLSDRHVRRLENEEVRLTVDAAEKLAAAFGLDLLEFLDELSGRLSALRDVPENEPRSNAPAHEKP